jgi:hypothetical protein
VLRAEARKLIKVPESFMFLHPKFIALFLNPLQVIKLTPGQGFCNFLANFDPLDLEKIEKKKGG